MSIRPLGYFWVSSVIGDEYGLSLAWEVAFWNGEEWLRAGDDNYYYDNDFVGIDETPIIKQS